MVLVDTSIWIDHLHRPVLELVTLLDSGLVLSHPVLVGEIAMGNLKQRSVFVHWLQRLPQAFVATDFEVLKMVETDNLYGRGIGYIDAHLLAATRMTPGAKLWTRDKRLDDIAESLQVRYAPGS